MLDPQLDPATRRALERLDAFEAEQSLLEFARQGWNAVEEGTVFQENWHIEAIADHLEAVADRQIRRLLINLPPRHMKSRLVNVFFPAWVWAQNPDPKGIGHGLTIRPGTWRGPGVKFMHLAYAQDLSTRDSVDCRKLLNSAWFQRNWGHRVSFSSDQNQKTRYQNNSGGHRIATSESGGVTGDGADIIPYDDPHNVKQADSEAVREETTRFRRESLSTRLNDPKTGCFIVVMQRVHERDVTGDILTREGDDWTHLCLPMEFERKHPTPLRTKVIRKSTGKVWTDDRVEGELLWPERFPQEVRDKWTASLGSYAAAGQLQQRPAPREGGLFKKHWFTIVPSAPVSAHNPRVRSWDFAGTAETKNDPDWTVGVRMSRDLATGIIYIEDVVRFRGTPHEVRNSVKRVAGQDGYKTRIRIPKDPGQAGKFQSGQFISDLAGWIAHAELETGSKEMRAEPYAAQIEAGNIVLVKGAWNDAFIDEHLSFPNGSHDDQVDAASGGFRALVTAPSTAVLGRQTTGHGR